MSYGVGEIPAILQGAGGITDAGNTPPTVMDVPLILQGAAQREVLNPQQAALVKSYQPGAGSSNLPILLILAGLAAFLFLGKARGGMTA